jgi:hypothetical protein
VSLRSLLEYAGIETDLVSVIDDSDDDDYPEFDCS